MDVLKIENTKNENPPKHIISCRIDDLYFKELKKRKISFTIFVETALKEAFPNIKV
jgi:hypothetical protein